MHVVLRDRETECVLVSCVVPFWEDDVLSAFFLKSVNLGLDGEQELWLNDLKSTELVVEVVDLDSEASLRTLKEDGEDSGWHGVEPNTWFSPLELSRIQAPDDYFDFDEEYVEIHLHATAKIDEERVTRLSVFSGVWRSDDYMMAKLDKWGVLEMLLDGKIRVTEW